MARLIAYAVCSVAFSATTAAVWWFQPPDVATAEGEASVRLKGLTCNKDDKSLVYVSV